MSDQCGSYFAPCSIHSFSSAICAGSELLFALRRRHHLIRIVRRDPREQFALCRIARNDRADAVEFRQRTIGRVETPIALRAFVRPVAGEAVVRKDRADVAIEADLARRARRAATERGGDNGRGHSAETRRRDHGQRSPRAKNRRGKCEGAHEDDYCTVTAFAACFFRTCKITGSEDCLLASRLTAKQRRSCSSSQSAALSEISPSFCPASSVMPFKPRLSTITPCGRFSTSKRRSPAAVLTADFHPCGNDLAGRDRDLERT